MDPALEPPEGTSSANTLILAPKSLFPISELQNCERIHAYCFKPLRCGKLVQQPQEAKMDVNSYRAEGLSDLAFSKFAPPNKVTAVLPHPGPPNRH